MTDEMKVKQIQYSAGTKIPPEKGAYLVLWGPEDPPDVFSRSTLSGGWVNDRGDTPEDMLEWWAEEDVHSLGGLVLSRATEETK